MENIGNTNAKEKKSEVMRKVRLEKVVINVGVGEAGDALEKAKKILENITKRKAICTKAKVKLPQWGIRPGMEIGLKVTLRGQAAEKFLTDAFYAVHNTISKRSFDNAGNFGFGIKEHIELPNVKYDPQLGIIGMDVLVNLSRPGRRVLLRKKRRARIGKKHLLNKEDAIQFVQEKFNVKIV